MHQRIDQTSVLAVLTRPGLRLPVYAAAMAALQRAYLEIDSLFADVAHLCPAMVPAYLPRSPLITRDLQALHHFSSGALSGGPSGDPESGDPGPLPFPKRPGSEAEYLGMRYVVEGAQLGSRVIYAHLVETLGSQLPQFGSFWIPDPLFRTSWPAVLTALAQLESRDSLAAVALAARLTFRHMELNLVKCNSN